MIKINAPSMKTQSKGNVFPGGFDLMYQITKLIRVVEIIVINERKTKEKTCSYVSMFVDTACINESSYKAFMF